MKEVFLTASLVVYHNTKEDVQKVIDSFLAYESTSLLFIIDNSSNNSLQDLCHHPRLKYVFNNANVGFGAAHNIAFEEAYRLKSKYHILLNPDVSFDGAIIEDLILKAESDALIGLLMPKVVYTNGETQYLCKLLPTPVDLIFRRFIPIENFQEKHKQKFELRFISYNQEAEIPVLSGCFMMIRTSILEKVDGFDNRYFMYLEDVDLCRRIGEISKLAYYPKVQIVHNYEKGSYKNKKLLMYHITSAIKYFNKWGWIFDYERSKINRTVLQKLNYKKS